MPNYLAFCHICFIVNPNLMFLISLYKMKKLFELLWICCTEILGDILEAFYPYPRIPFTVQNFMYRYFEWDSRNGKSCPSPDYMQASEPLTCLSLKPSVPHLYCTVFHKLPELSRNKQIVGVHSTLFFTEFF